MKTYKLPDGSRVYAIGYSIADYLCFIIVLTLFALGLAGMFGWVTLLAVLFD